MIDLSKIDFSYLKNAPIFDDFSLHIGEGSLFGLLGPNGAGKTSLISLISGLYKPSKGDIHINKLSYNKSKNAILDNLSLVPQEYAFYSQLTVIENLQFFSRLYPNQENISSNIDDAINATKLSEYKHNLANTLSGGLKRRLNLAIGLLNKPSLLILDEPTVGIDPQSRHFILDAIQDLNKQGITILYTSHYMNEIEKICTEVAILDKGKILVHDSIQKLLNQDTYLNLQVEASAEQLKNIEGRLLKYNLKVSGKVISGQLESVSLLNDLLEFLNSNNILIKQINYGQQNLEDLFFNLTKTQLRDS